MTAESPTPPEADGTEDRETPGSAGPGDGHGAPVTAEVAAPGTSEQSAPAEGVAPAPPPLD